MCGELYLAFVLKGEYRERRMKRISCMLGNVQSTGAAMSVEDIFCTVAALVPSQRNSNSVVALCYHRLSDHYDGTPLDRFTISRELLARHLSMIPRVV